MRPGADGMDQHHIVGDALELLAEPWDLLIAHPPCTYLSQIAVACLRSETSPGTARAIAAQWTRSASLF